jgi:hypothetical protein
VHRQEWKAEEISSEGLGGNVMTNGKIHKEKMLKAHKNRRMLWLLLLIFFISSFMIVSFLFFIPVMMHMNCLQGASSQVLRDGQDWCGSKNLNLVDIQWRMGVCQWVCG